MGTDIHGVFQRQNNGAWSDVPSNYEQGRHYQLFAVLANVRNGFGFAGIPTGEVVEPISQPRGLPDDFEVADGKLHPIDPNNLPPWDRENYPDVTLWMGYHSFSWLTGEEMLAWFETAPSLLKTGILSKDVYTSWDKVQPPSCYCASISGQGIVIVDQDSAETTTDWTHVLCSWSSDLKQELAYFFDEVAKLVSEYGEIRFVFGFDS